jgi:TonB family protein
VSIRRMSTTQTCAFICFIAVVSPVFGQQSTNHPPRIICTPPTVKVLKMVRPTVSPDAKNISGIVVVEVEIDKAGKPTSVKILKGHPILAAAVLEAVKQWRWKPLRLNGLPVKADSTITVNFEPR